MGWTHTGNVTASIFTGSMHIRTLLIEGHRHTETGYATQQDEYARIIKYYNKSPIEVYNLFVPHTGYAFVNDLTCSCQFLLLVSIAAFLWKSIWHFCMDWATALFLYVLISYCYAREGRWTVWGGELLCKINFLVDVRALCEVLVVRMGNKINKIIGLEVIDTYIFRQSIIFVNYSTFYYYKNTCCILL